VLLPIDVTFGKETVASVVQLSNALLPIVVASGKEILVIAVPLNALAPMNVTFGKETVASVVQLSNAEIPIIVASGKEILVILGHDINTAFPIVVIVDGDAKVTVVSAVQSPNTLSPIIVGPEGIVILVNVARLGPVKPVTIPLVITGIPTVLIYKMNNTIFTFRTLREQ